MHAMLSLTIILVLSMLMNRLHLRLTRSRRSTNSCSASTEAPTRWCHQHSKGSWPFTLQFVVHLEIHRGSPSSPSPLGCWTSMGRDTTLSDPFLNMKPFWQCSCYFDLSKLFPVLFCQQVNQVQRISHVHHSHPELIMWDRVECLLEVQKHI